LNLKPQDLGYGRSHTEREDVDDLSDDIDMPDYHKRKKTTHPHSRHGMDKEERDIDVHGYQSHHSSRRSPVLKSTMIPMKEEEDYRSHRGLESYKDPRKGIQGSLGTQRHRSLSPNSRGENDYRSHQGLGSYKDPT
jgi:hypothetical protein